MWESADPTTGFNSSVDGGATWQAGGRPADGISCPIIRLLGPDGMLYVTYGVWNW